ncbi:MAG: lipoyl(octanoyl) transferase LipB [Calditrichaeota bacterium]|nr:lipoyl(octanoyl) transferase LipB [Calditrichota bacterium]
MTFVFQKEPSDYRRVWGLQLKAHAEVLGGEPDTVIFTEHKPVVTIGKAGGEDHLLVSPERLRELGIDLVHTDRGGDVTYHGPGQLVIYPIFDLRRHYLDVHRFLRDLEEVAIRVLREYGIEGFRVPGRTGVWTAKGKIAAIGVHVKKWVTYHGMAFNVTDEVLRGFQQIVPCGIADGGVCSLEGWGVKEIISIIATKFATNIELHFDHNQD